MRRRSSVWEGRYASTRMARSLVGGLSFHGVSGLCMSSLAHRLSGGIQAHGIRSRPMQAWVSCSGGRTFACDLHALGGDQCCEQCVPDLLYIITTSLSTQRARETRPFIDTLSFRGRSRHCVRSRGKRRTVGPWRHGMFPTIMWWTTCSWATRWKDARWQCWSREGGRVKSWSNAPVTKGGSRMIL